MENGITPPAATLYFLKPNSLQMCMHTPIHKKKKDTGVQEQCYIKFHPEIHRVY